VKYESVASKECGGGTSGLGVFGGVGSGSSVLVVSVLELAGLVCAVVSLGLVFSRPTLSVMASPPGFARLVFSVKFSGPVIESGLILGLGL
jgi:hypothetical protein